MKTAHPVLLLKWAAAFLLLTRFITLPFSVITDQTESRYAEIGRKMMETGDFITPFISHNLPFWAKPPLSFWATALSYRLFGVNQFAAHLPGFILMLGLIALVYFFIKRHFDTLTALMAAVMILCCPVFLVIMSGVMTDPALTFSITLAFIAFFNALNSDRKSWGFLFFAALALALLAKGPLGIVLVGIPLTLWATLKKKWKECWQKIPWLPGTALMLFIALPWYILAEIKTPGFLRYFIIGEHFERYLVPNWGGDLYGTGRGGTRGIIFLYYMLGLFPWPLYFAVRLFSREFRQTCLKTRILKEDKLLYLFLWVIFPLIFFSFSRNVILTYVLPIIAPGIALMAHVIRQHESVFHPGKWIAFTALNFIALTALSVLPFSNPELIPSDKFIIEAYQNARHDKEAPLIYFKSEAHSSAWFYSQGKFSEINDIKALRLWVKEKKTLFAVIDHKHLDDKDLGNGMTLKPLYSHRGRTLVEVSALENP